jgi:hypothetical protein
MMHVINENLNFRPVAIRSINFGLISRLNINMLSVAIFAFIVYSTVINCKVPANYTSFQFKVNNIFHKYEIQNVIVDSDGLQQTIGSISGSKVLFSKTMLGYRFTNLEILDRLWISKGCPSYLSEDDKKMIYGYTIEASQQKINRIEHFQNILHLEIFDNYIEASKLKISKIEKNIDAEINNYMISKDRDCLNLARFHGVDAIIYSSDSNWNNIFIEQSLPFFEIGNGYHVAVVNAGS